MNSRFWTGVTLGLVALLSIVFGTWFLIGGPYGAAYFLLDTGIGLLVVAVFLILSAIRKKRANKSVEDIGTNRAESSR